jgi:hypothetical protein
MKLCSTQHFSGNAAWLNCIDIQGADAANGPILADCLTDSPLIDQIAPHSYVGPVGSVNL